MNQNNHKKESISGYDALKTLALNLIWVWNVDAYKVWQTLNPDLWELTHNPWVILQSASISQLEEFLSNPDFKKTVYDLLEHDRICTKTPAWFQKTYPNPPLKKIAYFSMEFMLSEALPIYSGGLGNVAGDQLKAASDLGVPVIGIGLLYQQGYFRQLIDKDGMQQAVYPFNDPGQLPIQPLRNEKGEWLRLEIPLPGWQLWIRTWEVKIGRVRLFLLDANDPANYPPHRAITNELYGGGSEHRLKQEMILGICGWRLLDTLGIDPEVCHLNEGHAAFAILERARCYKIKHNVSFEVALTATRAGNHFTTHTAVPAGFDVFQPSLIEQFLGNYAKEQLGISVEDLLALGRKNRDNPTEPFNMAYLAARGSAAINGVSELHGKVSKYIFSSIFPRWPLNEIPVESVTNGVHIPTWDSSEAEKIWIKHCGEDRWMGTVETLEQDFRAVSNEELWAMRNHGRKSLIEYARKHAARVLQARGIEIEKIQQIRQSLNPDILTLGFARRFATYKRPNLLLSDPERLIRILVNPEKPVQLIIAGKAHPADRPGQELIQQWVAFSKIPEVQNHIFFLSDYDMLMTVMLVQGVDVWINNPRRPWEACGTSGMKVLANGGLNLSELDGWWAEAYTPEVGWAIGDGEEHGTDPGWDAHEANQLYELLEKEIVPEFYQRDEKNFPITWLNRIRESMAQLTPRYSATRTVKEYTEKYYLPSAEGFKKRSEKDSTLAKQIHDWQKDLEQNWHKLRFDHFSSKTEGSNHIYEVKVYLDSIDPCALKIELCGLDQSCTPMQQIQQLEDAKTYIYKASVPADHPIEHFTPRIVPFVHDMVIPIEAPFILWQK